MAATPPRVGKVQLQIMQVLWERGEATAREITDTLCQTAPIAHSTVQTLLRKLEMKDAVAHEMRDRVFVFRPLSQQSEVTQTAARDLLTRVFGGSVYGLVSHLLKHETISDDELKRLRELIDAESSRRNPDELLSLPGAPCADSVINSARSGVAGPVDGAEARPGGSDADRAGGFGGRCPDFVPGRAVDGPRSSVVARLAAERRRSHNCRQSRRGRGFAPALHSPVPARPATAPPPSSLPLPSPGDEEMSSLPSPSPVPAPLSTAPQLPRIYAALVAFWAAGAAVWLLWLCVCQWHLTRLRREACAITSGPAAEMLASLTARPPCLLVHPAVRSPFLAGVRRPAIFLPTAYATDFPPDALRAILAHELAHLARRDCAWTLASRLLCAVLWPQPLLWLLCRRLEQIGEEACDLSVLAQNCPPRAYADCLLSLAQRHPLPRRERALGAGVAPFRSSLGRRISLILSKGTHTMSLVSPRLRLTVAALTLAAALSGAFIVSSAPAQVDKPSLVGSWLDLSSQPKAAVIFDANGQVTVFNGTSNRQHGRYAVSGSKLTVTITRIADGHNPPQDQTRPQVDSVGFRLTGDTLTIILPNGKINTAHRVTNFTKDMLLPDPKPTPQIAAGGTAPALSQARLLAGLTLVQGPGVVVTLRDSKKPFPGNLPPGVAPLNIIHDTDINQIIDELKAAGAEAIAVNGQRLVATSPIRCAGPTIFVNNTPIAPPYAIQAIGNPDALQAALSSKGSMRSQLQQFDPAMITVGQAQTLTLPAYLETGVPLYAKPITNAVPVLPGAKLMTMPPITQEAAREQFRAQVLAAPKLHTFLENRITYTMSDVNVTQVLYSAKDDTFTLLYDLSWQPTMPSDGPQSGTATFSPDGYGHYYGIVITRPGEGSIAQYAYVTLK